MTPQGCIWEYFGTLRRPLGKRWTTSGTDFEVKLESAGLFLEVEWKSVTCCFRRHSRSESLFLLLQASNVDIHGLKRSAGSVRSGPKGPSPKGLEQLGPALL